ncbi:Hypothetical protein MVR_LOCUS54 [uncultured virus]|nr:Hypothetical protein MVR_LOCUS54 [uncultured virus]
MSIQYKTATTSNTGTIDSAIVTSTASSITDIALTSSLSNALIPTAFAPFTNLNRLRVTAKQKKVNLTANTKLESVIISKCNIEAISLPKHNTINHLDVSYNKHLTHIPPIQHIQHLNTTGASIGALDVSNSPATQLNCRLMFNLKRLDVRGCKNQIRIRLTWNHGKCEIIKDQGQVVQVEYTYEADHYYG